MKSILMTLGAIGVVGAASSRRRGSRVPLPPGANRASLIGPKEEKTLKRLWGASGEDKRKKMCIKQLGLAYGAPLPSFTRYQALVAERMGRWVCPHGLGVSMIDVATNSRLLEYIERGVVAGSGYEYEHGDESWFECSHGKNEESVDWIPSIRRMKSTKGVAPLRGASQLSVEEIVELAVPAPRGQLYYWFDWPGDFEIE